MSKLFLPALAPVSEGARRLAWWLTDVPADDTMYRRKRDLDRIGVTVSMLDRLLGGTASPVDGLASRIEALTGGDVRWSDWLVDAAGGWGDRPADRPVDRSAPRMAA